MNHLATTTDLIRSRLGVERPSSRPISSAEGMAGHVLSRAVRRLEIVCITALCAVAALWFLVNLALGTLAEEFQSPHQWLPPITAIACPLVVIGLIRTRRFQPATLIRVGLVYEVIMSIALTCASQLGAFQGLAASALRQDRMGIAHVAPWTLFFSVLVPARPREALVALVASASSVPLVYLAQVKAGMAPALPAHQFLPIFVFPYVAAVVLAYIAARTVHQLGVEVRRAQELGSYKLGSLLGRGGMGEVWLASHRTLARPAAVKLIRRDALANDPALAAVAAARFEREAQVIASLQSPHTVALYDYGTSDDGTLFYVMELLDGVDLDALVRRHGPLPAERVVHILGQACASLAEAHRRGVVHRDIKPANIYLCRRGIDHDVVKVLDFGLVKQLAPSEEAGAAALTRADVVAGTPQFMAPEMVLGQGGVDGRADLYALGCVAFWLLTGRLVFQAETVAAAIVAHASKEPPAPSAVTEMPIPQALDAIVLACLAKDPAARPQTSEALAARLREIPLPRSWSDDDAARWWATHHPAAS